MIPSLLDSLLPTHPHPLSSLAKALHLRRINCGLCRLDHLPCQARKTQALTIGAITRGQKQHRTNCRKWGEMEKDETSSARFCCCWCWVEYQCTECMELFSASIATLFLCTCALLWRQGPPLSSGQSVAPVRCITQPCPYLKGQDGLTDLSRGIIDTQLSAIFFKNKLIAIT